MLQEVEDLQNIFRRFLFMLPISGYPVNVLEFCVKELSQINYTQELLLTTLWEGTEDIFTILQIVNGS